MEKTKTIVKTESYAALIFNGKGEILTNLNATTDLVLPYVNVSVPTQGNNTDNVKYAMDKLVETLNEFTGMDTGLGDLVYDDYRADGTRIFVFMGFVTTDTVNDGTAWTPLSKFKPLPDGDIMNVLHMHLINTLFNTQLMKMGNCYENTVTGEAIYVIYIIDDNMRNKKFLVVESTMGEEPLVLPMDAYWGMPMKWISHVRFMEIVMKIPKTLADIAKHLFITAHNMTNHRYGGKPYSYHLSAVVEQFHKYKQLIPEEDWDRVEAELYGHDSLEDARLTFNNIKDVFGEVIAEGCYSMTNDKGRNRKTRAGKAYYAGLAVDKYGEFKKLCDRLANTTDAVNNGHSMLGVHKKELSAFEKRLRTHGDTYKEMWDELKSLTNE